MTDTVTVDVVCSVCGVMSRQQVVPPLVSDGFPDLDGRPAAPARSALVVGVAVCPACGYAADPQLRVPEGVDPEEVRGLLVTPAFAAVGAAAPDRTAGRYAQWAWLLRAVRMDGEAGWRWVKAAWACDDAGAADAAAAYRAAAADDWRRAGKDRVPGPEGALERLVIMADTQRRSGAFSDALESILGQEEVMAADDLGVLGFIADRAWRLDADRYTYGDVTRTGGAPATRRVPPLSSPDEGAVVDAFEVEGSAVELLRCGAASAWVCRRDGAPIRQCSVAEALELLFESPGTGGRDVAAALAQTSAEIDFLRQSGNERAAARLEREYEIADEMNPDEPAAHVATSSMRSYLDVLGELGGFETRVVAHGAVTPEVLAEAIRHVVAPLRPASATVIDCAGGYVQLLHDPDATTVYLEALDPAANERRPFGSATRETLLSLGWFDPKVAPVPYPNAEFAELWSSGNFVREMSRGDVDRIAEVLAATLEAIEGGKVTRVEVRVSLL